MSKRYTIVLADRQTGSVRRFTIRLRPFALAFGAVLTFPVLVGLGLRLSATTEVNHLRTSKATLEQENTSYREATGALTAQIESLQSAINELGIRARLDPDFCASHGKASCRCEEPRGRRHVRGRR